MLTYTYRELFVAIAGCAGALTGLLFVALSVSPRHRSGSDRYVIQEVRAAAALLAFVNALAVSLFGLIPDLNVGYTAVTLGVSGVLFTAAALRSILASPHARHQWRNQAGLIFLLLVIFGAELVNGIEALVHPLSAGPLQGVSISLVASLIVGVARAWELVGDRDTGIMSSIAVLTGRRNPWGPPREEDDMLGVVAEASPGPAQPVGPPGDQAKPAAGSRPTTPASPGPGAGPGPGAAPGHGTGPGPGTGPGTGPGPGHGPS
ncbi:MAG TPA: hypothetical protein VMR14_00270 [Streptosporangiaceae bacterium]|nr:hypothetical protein [Streptosporangiaceae bacterium]